MTPVRTFQKRASRRTLSVCSDQRDSLAKSTLPCTGRSASRLLTSLGNFNFQDSTMKPSFEEIATAIWQQALVDNEPVVTVGGERYPVTPSKAKKLRQVVFKFDG